MPADQPAPTDLHAYLNWLEQVWLLSIKGPPSPKRPTLTLIRGGRGDAS